MGPLDESYYKNIFDETYEKGDAENEFIISEEAIKTFPIGNDFQRLEAPKESNGRKLIFIDGGIQELYKKGRTAFYAIKVAYASFSANKRNENKVYNNIARIDRNEEDRKSFRIRLKDSFPFLSSPLKDDSDAEEWEESIGNFRRELELNLALFLSQENIRATIIIDGSLFPKKNDKEIISELIKENKSKNAIIGISKSSSMKTNKGNNAIDLIFELSKKKYEDDAWIYFPLFYGNEGLKTGCIRLHNRAAMCFRIDLLNPSSEISQENKEAINELMLNSIDGVFLGYPYGLIYVDRIARIGNNEADFLRMKYFISKKKEAFDAHSILDNIS